MPTVRDALLTGHAPPAAVVAPPAAIAALRATGTATSPGRVLHNRSKSNQDGDVYRITKTLTHLSGRRGWRQRRRAIAVVGLGMLDLGMATSGRVAVLRWARRWIARDVRRVVYVNRCMKMRRTPAIVLMLVLACELWVPGGVCWLVATRRRSSPTVVARLGFRT